MHAEAGPPDAWNRIALDPPRAYGATPVSGAVRVEVADFGEGITPVDREQIFNPYFTTKENGTVLGLAISREIASHHDGSLDFESHDRGTTFVLFLPLQRKHA